MGICLPGRHHDAVPLRQVALSSKEANFNGSFPYGEGAAKADYLGRPSRVGSYPPNAFGLYDMHGNVFEWCSDRYDKDYYASSPKRDPQGPLEGTPRVIRGGCWHSRGQGCRSAYRFGGEPAYRDLNLGFRVAVVPSE